MCQRGLQWSLDVLSKYTVQFYSFLEKKKNSGHDDLHAQYSYSKYVHFEIHSKLQFNLNIE